MKPGEITASYHHSRIPAPPIFNPAICAPFVGTAASATGTTPPAPAPAQPGTRLLGKSARNPGRAPGDAVRRAATGGLR